MGFPREACVVQHDSIVNNLVITYAQAYALARRALPDADDRDVEAFLDWLFEMKTTISITELLMQVFMDRPIEYEPAGDLTEAG